MIEKKELSIIGKVELIKKEAKTTILAKTIKSEEKLDILIKQYSDVEIKDKAGFDFAVKGSKEMKKIRSAIDSNRLDITRPFNDFKSDMIAFVKPWTEKLSAAETEINEKIKTFENIEKAKAEKLFAERCQLLAKSGFTMVSGNYQCGAVFLSPEQIQDFNQEQFDFHIEIGKTELKRQEVEAQRRAEEAEELQKQRDEIEKQLAEIAQMKAEIAKDRKSVDDEIERLNPVIKETVRATGNKVSEVKHVIDGLSETAEKIDKVIEPAQTVGFASNIKIITDEKPPAKETVDQYKLGRKNGFNEFRKMMTSLMESDAKFTRPQLIEWVNTLELCK